MSTFSPNEFDSVDLTEDEDSRDTIVESEITSQNLNFRNKFENIPLPPLIPIPKLSAPSKASNSVEAPLLKKIDVQLLNNNSPPIQTPYSGPTTNVPHTSNGKTLLIKKNNKYYRIVIPPNVIPTCESGGPVIINIPEVGPLVIKLDPQVKYQPTAKPAPLEPFALNFDDIIEKASTGEMTTDKSFANRECTSAEKVFSTSEKAFSCWRSLSPRTRNKNCFNGFSKRELATTKRCFNQIKTAVIKCQKQVDSLINDNLLITKRIVILQDPEQRRINRSKNRKRRGSKIKNLKVSVPYVQIYNYSAQTLNLENRFKHLIKPCYINMTRQRDLDNANRTGKRVTLNTKASLIPQLHYYSGNTSRRLSGTIRNLPTRKANEVADTETLQKRKTLLLSKLIEDPKTFNNEIAFIKPILVINEHTYSIVQFTTEFSKSNIVFSLGKDREFPEEILKSEVFENAVLEGYVKIIDCDILCQYFKREAGFPSFCIFRN